MSTDQTQQEGVRACTCRKRDPPACVEKSIFTGGGGDTEGVIVPRSRNSELRFVSSLYVVDAYPRLGYIGLEFRALNDVDPCVVKRHGEGATVVC